MSEYLTRKVNLLQAAIIDLANIVTYGSEYQRHQMVKQWGATLNKSLDEIDELIKEEKP